VNACVTLSRFPQAWKTSKVVVIGKPNKQSYECLSSFRPISLINTLGKVLEKVILGRALWISKSPHWLNENQHGFTSGKSTESAVHSLIAFCESGKRSRVSTCAFLDKKSAFDAAWHPSILCSLVKLKCPHYLICLIASFLANHSAILSVDGEELLITINLGCPQGGVLSPFLWLILINDVLESVFPFPALILGYADGFTLATWHKDPAMATLHLQLMCNSVIAWCSTRKLSLNEAKKIFMLIGHKGDSALLNICINGVRIPPSLEVQLLGFTIDHRLS
jgi:hypothetical protein